MIKEVLKTAIKKKIVAPGGTKQPAQGQPQPNSTTTTPASTNEEEPKKSKMAELIETARANRGENISAKAEKVEAVADRKKASAEKIAARKLGKAEIIRARAELERAKRGQ